jgi:hypothetical protein
MRGAVLLRGQKPSKVTEEDAWWKLPLRGLDEDASVARRDGNGQSTFHGLVRVLPGANVHRLSPSRAVLHDTSTHNHLLSAYVRAMKGRAFMANQAHLNAIEPG